MLTDPADRVLEESVGRKGRLDNLELLDPLEGEDELEMTDPKETLYDTHNATHTHTHNNALTLPHSDFTVLPIIQVISCFSRTSGSCWFPW